MKFFSRGTMHNIIRVILRWLRIAFVIFLCLYIALVIDWINFRLFHSFRTTFEIENIRISNFDEGVSDETMYSYAWNMGHATDKDYFKYRLNYGLSKESVDEIGVDYENFAAMYFGFDYFSNKGIGKNPSKLLGVFFKGISFGNELDQSIVGFERRKDMDIEYFPGKKYGTAFRVFLRRDGRSNDELLRLVANPSIEVVGVENYDEEKEMGFEDN